MVGSANLTQDTWTRYLDIARALLEALWEAPEEAVAPPRLLTGTDLIQALALAPGPEIGRLLEAIREAQASGEIATREEALAFARAHQN